jgi:hypothetical protein
LWTITKYYITRELSRSFWWTWSNYFMGEICFIFSSTCLLKNLWIRWCMRKTVVKCVLRILIYLIWSLSNSCIFSYLTIESVCSVMFLGNTDLSTSCVFIRLTFSSLIFCSLSFSLPFPFSSLSLAAFSSLKLVTSLSKCLR